MFLFSILDFTTSILIKSNNLDYHPKLLPMIKKGNEVNGEYAPPPEIVEVEGEEQHLVEEILDS
uniref:Uncharacterized protein n=1 Tax=Moniliophthora roreri TaxID=221103 RepID=A0A0W0FWI9_MONRR